MSIARSIASPLASSVARPITGSGGVSGLLDFLPTSQRTGGFAVDPSRLFSSYAGPLVRIKRPSDDAETDLGAGSSRFTGAMVSAFGDSCLVAKQYDQLGSNNVARGTVDLRPAVSSADYPAITYDGVNDTLSAAHSANLAITGPFTICLWVKTSDANGVFVSKSTANYNTAANTVYEIGTLSGNFRARISDGTTTEQVNISAAPILDDAWHHIGVVWTGTNLIAYFDGVAVSTVPTTILAIQSVANELVIGGSSSWFFAGQLDSLLMLPTPLDAATIAAIRTATLRGHS